MLILEVLLEIKSKQSDVAATFLHDDVEEGENIFVEMPIFFQKKVKVFKLRENMCGIPQRLCAFCEYLTRKLNNCG